MYPTNIDYFEDIGLNADWCISTYQLDNNHFVFDNEDDTFTLSKVTFDGLDELQIAEREECYNNLITGTFEECINYYNMEVSK